MSVGTLVVQLPPAAFAQPSVTDGIYYGCHPATFTSNDTFAQNLAAVVISLTHNSSRFLFSLASSTTGTALNNSVAAAPQHALFGYSATSVGSGSPTQLTHSPNAWAISTHLNAPPASRRCLTIATAMTVADPCPVKFSSWIVTTSSETPPLSSLTTTPPRQASIRQLLLRPPSPAALRPRDRRRRNHKATIVGIVVGISALLAIVAALALYFLKRQKQRVKSGAEIYTKAQGNFLKELQDATDNFHPAKKLGQGGFGPVYQGRLRSGKEVAIKMLKVIKGS